jgi:hypothetical protein
MSLLSHDPIGTQDATIAQSDTLCHEAGVATTSVDSEHANTADGPHDPVQTVFSIVRLDQNRVLGG